jgi:hypothetical protein
MDSLFDTYHIDRDLCFAWHGRRPSSIPDSVNLEEYGRKAARPTRSRGGKA